ncbi:hypothetical protein M0R45_012638 [Rubus argutus]|uniref:Uncharacterized protein n=1 Tax=Rubus argutus TaxID=59490 RepID=A0AAW1YDA5_RUBAR
MWQGIGDIGSSYGSSASTDYSDEMPSWGSGVASASTGEKIASSAGSETTRTDKRTGRCFRMCRAQASRQRIEVSWWKHTATLISGHDDPQLNCAEARG